MLEYWQQPSVLMHILHSVLVEVQDHPQGSVLSYMQVLETKLRFISLGDRYLYLLSHLKSK